MGASPPSGNSSVGATGMIWDGKTWRAENGTDSSEVVSPLPPPAMQESPTAQRGVRRRSSAANAGLGQAGTVRTSGIGVSEPATTARGSLLGL